MPDEGDQNEADGNDDNESDLSLLERIALAAAIVQRIVLTVIRITTL